MNSNRKDKQKMPPKTQFSILCKSSQATDQEYIHGLSSKQITNNTFLWALSQAFLHQSEKSEKSKKMGGLAWGDGKTLFYLDYVWNLILNILHYY